MHSPADNYDNQVPPRHPHTPLIYILTENLGYNGPMPVGDLLEIKEIEISFGHGVKVLPIYNLPHLTKIDLSEEPCIENLILCDLPQLTLLDVEEKQNLRNIYIYGCPNLNIHPVANLANFNIEFLPSTEEGIKELNRIYQNRFNL